MSLSRVCSAPDCEACKALPDTHGWLLPRPTIRERTQKYYAEARAMQMDAYRAEYQIQNGCTMEEAGITHYPSNSETFHLAFMMAVLEHFEAKE